MTKHAGSSGEGATESAGRVSRNGRIAVLIPCLDEEPTVAEVVRQFREELPEAIVYVFDNGSSDRTAEMARGAGAIVVNEPRRGKGRVVRRMFSHVEADAYLLVDGDLTYPAASARRLLLPILNGQADMVVGSRWHGETGGRGKIINFWGNQFLCGATNLILGTGLTDVLSGYRALSRQFVKGIEVSSSGFEVEIELTVKAAARGRPIVEVPISSRPRPRGSRSKIRLVRDGLTILAKLLLLAYAHPRTRLGMK